MVAANVVAKEFVKKGIDEGSPVTQMKLQKMVYFAHGFHLAFYGEPLVAENFEAWKFGPVIPSLYQTYKSWGNNAILAFSTSEYMIHPNAIHPEHSFIHFGGLDERGAYAIDYTWQVTRNIDAITLSNWSHEPGSPWDQSYKLHNDLIPNPLIKEYFRRKFFPQENHGVHH